MNDHDHYNNEDFQIKSPLNLSKNYRLKDLSLYVTEKHEKDALKNTSVCSIYKKKKLIAKVKFIVCPTDRSHTKIFVVGCYYCYYCYSLPSPPLLYIYSNQRCC